MIRFSLPAFAALTKRRFLSGTLLGLVALTCLCGSGQFASAAKTPAPHDAVAMPSAASKNEVVAIAFSPGQAEALVLSVINEAKTELRVAVYTFTSKPIAEALLRAHQRGVKVAVVLDSPKKSARPSIIPFLKTHGIPLRLCSKYNIMHHKFIVADKVLTQTGSYNYTRAAATSNAENVIVLKGASGAGLYLREWQRIWDESTAP